MLTQVIGIGKGKRDLTNCALEPTKLNHGASGNSQVRIRNDLPIADIVKFLTGEYRMSKTRSSDLCWQEGGTLSSRKMVQRILWFFSFRKPISFPGGRCQRGITTLTLSLMS